MPRRAAGHPDRAPPPRSCPTDRSPSPRASAPAARCAATAPRPARTGCVRPGVPPAASRQPQRQATSTTAPIPSFAFVPSAMSDPPFASHAGTTGPSPLERQRRQQRRPGLALAPVLVVEPLAQPLHALGQPPAHGARRQPQLPGNVRGAPALVVAKQDRATGRARRAPPPIPPAPVHLGPFQQLLRRGRRRRRRSQDGSRPVLNAFRPPALAGHIAQHRRQPGLGRPSVSGVRAQRRRPGLLDQILGIPSWTRCVASRRSHSACVSRSSILAVPVAATCVQCKHPRDGEVLGLTHRYTSSFVA